MSDAPQIPFGVDPQYIHRIQSRTDELHKKSIQIREYVLRMKRRLILVNGDLQQEFQELHKEAAFLESACKDAVRRVTATVQKFRSVVKKAELQRLQSRVDMWAPEKRISKTSFKKLLEELS